MSKGVNKGVTVANSLLLHEIASEDAWRDFLKDNIGRIYNLAKRLKGTMSYNLFTNEEIEIIQNLSNNIIELAKGQDIISDKDLEQISIDLAVLDPNDILIELINSMISILPHYNKCSLFLWCTRKISVDYYGLLFGNDLSLIHI